MKKVSATIEVMDTDIDIEVDDDATEAEIMEELDMAAHEQVRVVNWEIQDD
jgi:hypothetical protein